MFLPGDLIKNEIAQGADNTGENWRSCTRKCLATRAYGHLSRSKLFGVCVCSAASIARLTDVNLGVFVIATRDAVEAKRVEVLPSPGSVLKIPWFYWLNAQVN